MYLHTICPRYLMVLSNLDDALIAQTDPLQAARHGRVSARGHETVVPHYLERRGTA